MPNQARIEYIALLQRKIELLKKHIILISCLFPHSIRIVKLETKRESLRNIQLLLLQELEAEHDELINQMKKGA